MKNKTDVFEARAGKRIKWHVNSQSQTVVWKIHQSLTKRFFDFVFSLAIVLLISPLYVVIGAAIRLSSPGKIIYSQQRLGQRGKVFNCYKFRTMYSDSDRRLSEILSKDPKLRAEWERTQKLRNDPRVFPFGRYLRKMSLDELPQFWNVLKGDLSVVGPRPYMVSQWKKIAPFANQILKIRPGITGLWQTSGRSSTTFYERIILDREYVSRHSFWFDCQLILKTISQLLFPKDAF